MTTLSVSPVPISMPRYGSLSDSWSKRKTFSVSPSRSYVARGCLSLGDDLSLVYPADVYAAARGWWAMNPGSQEDAPGYLVLARSRDRVLGAYRVKSWIQSPAGDGHWGLVGEPADMEAQLRYVGRQVPREFRTSRNPIRFVGENEFPPPIVYGPEE